jgi:hypothetical protein
MSAAVRRPAVYAKVNPRKWSTHHFIDKNCQPFFTVSPLRKITKIALSSQQKNQRRKHGLPEMIPM